MIFPKKTVNVFLPLMMAGMLAKDSLAETTNAATVTNGVIAPASEKASPKAVAEEDSPKNMQGLRIAAPAGMTIEWDVAYLAEERKEKADLYLPTNTPAGKLCPAILIMHGGGFNDGDKARPREINFCTNLAARGYVCMSINYKLSRPEARDKATWPQCVYDAKTAVRWLRKNAARMQIDPERIGAMGGSAGGNLAAMLATTDAKDGLEGDGPYQEFSTKVKCAVDFYGAVKLLEYHDMKMFSKTRAEAPELYEKGSPVNYVTKGDAPMLISHGSADKMVNVSQSEALVDAFKKAGVEVEFLVVPDGPHTYNLNPKQKDMRPAVFAFLDKYLKRADPVAPRITRTNVQ